MVTAEARAARERKQKIFVAVGGVVLLALVAFQLPRYLGGSPSAGGEAASEATAGAPVSSGADRTGPLAVALVDTDRPLPAGPGKLSSLTGLSPKDPFVQLVKQPTPKTGAGAGGKDTAAAERKGFTLGGASAAAVTVVSVNGVRQALVPGALFPAANPVFVLVGEQPDKKTVTIGVAGGAYENGARTTRLALGKPLVLVNTTTGARYRLVLVAVGDGSAAGSAPAGTGSKPSGSSSP